MFRSSGETVRRESMNIREGSFEVDDCVWALRNRPRKEFVEQASPAVAACRINRRRPFRKVIVPPLRLKWKKMLRREVITFDHPK